MSEQSEQMATIVRLTSKVGRLEGIIQGVLELLQQPNPCEARIKNAVEYLTRSQDVIGPRNPFLDSSHFGTPAPKQ